MSTKKDQHKVGTPEKPRGQQMGEPGPADQNREAKADTPSLRGRREDASEAFADNSTQQTGSDAATPRSNTPSVPAANPAGQPLGQTGGEKQFKQRQAKARKGE